jgi:hypothetical protein
MIGSGWEKNVWGAFVNKLEVFGRFLNFLSSSSS